MVSVLVSYLLIKLIKRIGRGQVLLARVAEKLTHTLGAVFVAIEGHLICRYIYPVVYPLFPIIHRYTGINLDGFKYD